MPAGNDIKEGKNKSCACADLIQGLRGHPSGGGRFYFFFFIENWQDIIARIRKSIIAAASSYVISGTPNLRLSH